MALEIPQLNSCCCGCTLKTGSKIIGWLELIASISMVVIFGLAVAALSTIEDNPDKLPDNPGRKEFLELIPIMKALMYILIAIMLFSCGLAFVLLLGVYQNKAQLVLIWVVASLTITVLSMMLSIAQFTVAHQSNILSSFVSFLINIYFILVVYSYYREIRNVSNNCA